MLRIFCMYTLSTIQIYMNTLIKLLFAYIFLLRPTPRRLSSGMNTCKTASMQIRFVSDGDPPMPKSERKIGEQKLNVNNSRVLTQSSFTSPVSLTLFL